MDEGRGFRGASGAVDGANQIRVFVCRRQAGIPVTSLSVEVEIAANNSKQIVMITLDLAENIAKIFYIRKPENKNECFL